jgi:AraC-like DNA-binding protein
LLITTKNRLGDWPIEIGLWVGAAATPNRLGGKGNTSPDSAVSRVKRYRRDGREAPAPIKACPWCGALFSRDSFACEPSDVAPKNMLIRCAGPNCPFTGRRALPILTVDEAIYRRLPAFVIATIDKFAGLPWLAEAGAFFGNVNRDDQWGFYGAADPAALGRRLFGGARRELVLERLLEVLLIEALRCGADTASAPSVARGLSDNRLVAALRAVHAQPAYGWTVANLAAEAAMSRSAFFARFTRVVGLPPMEYLIAWRMALAKRLLRSREHGIEQVAARVGYGSASTFSTAFARHVGISPMRYARGLTTR